jgi:hypothetical protein
MSRRADGNKFREALDDAKDDCLYVVHSPFEIRTKSKRTLLVLTRCGSLNNDVNISTACFLRDNS